MAAHKSGYPGLLVMPDGVEVASGCSVVITKEMAENVAVTEWIEAGWLVPAKVEAKK